jgi:hypothetical protein
MSNEPRAYSTHGNESIKRQRLASNVRSAGLLLRQLLL